jgi:hypothetical protein
VSVRTRAGGDQGGRPVAAFIEAARQEIESRALAPVAQAAAVT